MTGLPPPHAGGLTVDGAGAVPGATEVTRELLDDRVPARIAAKDATVWGPEAEPEASIRLGWLDAPRTSRALLPRLRDLRAELAGEGLDHVVLAGMGGSSLAPEVITRTLGVELTVLDTTDPDQVRAALADRLDRTVVVISSKSGTTVETDSHRRVYHQAFVDAGLSEADAGRRFVFVTDPGSPLEKTAADLGARAVFAADPTVGGRYSALTAFGLVPSALAGVDVEVLLDEAEAVLPSLGEPDSPGLALGAALGAAARAGRDKLVLAEDGTGLVGLGDWIEQLVAESTGKHGRGILPVVVDSPTAVGTRGEDVLFVTVGGSLYPGEAAGAGRDVAVNGPLGAQFMVWEFATAVAGRVLGINPFDQPDVEAAKNAARTLLDAPSGDAADDPLFTDDDIAVYGPVDLLGGVTTVDGTIDVVCGLVPDRGYLAVMAFLNRVGDAAAASVRDPLARRTDRAVTFGWGPRFLHSTGQYHKGGPPNGVYLQLTGDPVADLPVPGRPYTFGTLQRAQALGDASVLAARGRPVVRLHLHDRARGVARLLAAVEART
ncbi:MAG: glucose-6-phosphate isomerase [Mycobacterium sp.]|nr:glucose-6-phosphate isomerase [Mycobacterium sp.]